MYKQYRICNCCGKEYPLSREYFKRNTVSTVEHFHKVCKECESKEKEKEEWKDGLLLCHCCGKFKKEEDFTPNGKKGNKARHYKKTVCKECSSQKQKLHDIRLNNDDKLTKCLRFRLLGAKDRAQKSNKAFDITLQYLEKLWKLQEGKCALSGIPMTYELKLGRIATNVSIDKIDKNQGYIVGNIQLVCMACNQIKSDLTEEEMYNFCKKIVEQYENKNKKNTSAA